MRDLSVTPFRLSFWIICLVVVLQMMLGEWFYKSRVGPIYLSELFILIALLIVMPAVIMRLKIPRVTPVYLFILLSLLYFFYSLSQGREFRWVFRQSALFLYPTTAVISYAYVKRNYTVIKWDRFFSGLGLTGLFILLFRRFFPVLIGHGGWVDYLLLLIGYSFWLIKAKGVLKKILLAVGCIIIYRGGAAFRIAPFVVLWFYLFINYRKARLFLVLSGGTATLLAFVLVAGLADGNAVWRYALWLSVVQESWNRSWFLLGRGFGVQYIPEAAIGLIEYLATAQKSVEYQVMTIAPHNSLLSILIHLGIFGVLIFCYPIIKGFWLAVSGRLSSPGQVFLLSSFGFFIILSANMFLELPYAAVIFWMVYGALWACLQTCRRTEVFNRNDMGIKSIA